MNPVASPSSAVAASPELRDIRHRDEAGHLRDLAGHGERTLLTAAEDVDRGQAAVLTEWLAGAGRSDA